VVLIVPAFPEGVKAIRADSDETYHLDEMQRWAVHYRIICVENGPLLLEEYYFEGLNSLWNRARSKKVGGHWPRKVPQSRLPIMNRVAETIMDASAPQYQISPGTWSVMRKY